MNKIKQYLKKRRIRKLAERLLAHQPLMMERRNQVDMCDWAIATARTFYERWKELK